MLIQTYSTKNIITIASDTNQDGKWDIREYLTNSLTGLVVKYADLLQLVYDNPEEQCKKIKVYKEILQKAKEIKTLLQ